MLLCGHCEGLLDVSGSPNCWALFFHDKNQNDFFLGVDFGPVWSEHGQRGAGSGLTRLLRALLPPGGARDSRRGEEDEDDTD